MVDWSSHIVINILKFLHAGDGTLCVKTKSDTVEESVIEYVLDVKPVLLE